MVTKTSSSKSVPNRKKGSSSEKALVKKSNAKEEKKNSTPSKKRSNRLSKVIDDNDDIDSEHEEKVSSDYANLKASTSHIKEVNVKHSRKQDKNNIKKHFVSLERPQVLENEFPDKELKANESIMIFCERDYLKHIHQIIDENIKEDLNRKHSLDNFNMD
ncbi:hypothetical protein ABK040_013002 [Willaertia magna]